MSRDRLLQLCINQKTEFSHAKALISRPKQGKDRALLPQKPLVFQERSGIVENNAIKQLWVLFLQGPNSQANCYRHPLTQEVLPMSSIDIRNRDRIIEELRIFIRKILVEPEIIPHSMTVARELIDHEDADKLIAERISDTTNVKIPAEHSDADKLFLELLKEVVRDEQALY